MEQLNTHKAISRNDKFFKDVRTKVSALVNTFNSKGLLGSSTLMEGLCALLLQEVKAYGRNESDLILAQIKSGRCLALSPVEFSAQIRDRINEIIQPLESILVNNFSQSGISTESLSRMLKALNFSDHAALIADEMCSMLESSYAEYLISKKTAATHLDIANQTLNKAEEANRIAKAAYRASIAIGLLALIISIISLYYSHQSSSQNTQNQLAAEKQTTPTGL